LSLRMLEGEDLYSRTPTLAIIYNGEAFGIK